MFQSGIQRACINKLEQIQQRATKLVPEMAHLPYKARLQYLNLHSLYCQRQRGDLIEVYRLVNHLIQVLPDPFFITVNGVANHVEDTIIESSSHSNIAGSTQD